MFEAKVKGKSDQELEEIVNHPKDYQPEFLSAAIEEIKSRGVKIDTSKTENIIAEEQQTKINSAQRWKIPENLHPKIRLASNLLFASLVIGVIRQFFAQTSYSISGLSDEALPGLFSGLIVIAMAYAIRLGISWARILLLVFMVFGLFLTISFVSFYIEYAPVAGILELLQTLVQLYALVLLFQKPASNWYKENDGLFSS